MEDPIEKTRGHHHRARINIGTRRDLETWASLFEVTPEDVRAAVNAVGSDLEKVEMYLAVRLAQKDAAED
ncbi:MAG: DUF3606 domain-containing protein [Pseudomonadota bacterium]